MQKINQKKSRPEGKYDSRRLQDTRFHNACELLGILKSSAILLGSGSEGVVIKNGKYVYKIFDNITKKEALRVEKTLLSIVKLNTQKIFPKIISIKHYHDILACKYLYESLSPYKGGYGREIYNLLIQLKAAGFVYTNFKPSNIMVSEHGIQIIDIGCSVIDYNAKDEELAIRKAYLCWQFHFHPNLSTILSKSVTSDALPELANGQFLYDAVYGHGKNSKNHLDKFIEEFVKGKSPERMLDYGCGKPRDIHLQYDSNRLLAYDNDLSLRQIWQNKGLQNCFISDKNELLDQKHQHDFDMIICSLVLCTGDDENFSDILSNILFLASENAKILIAICDPRAIYIKNTVIQERHISTEIHYDDVFEYDKTIQQTHKLRREYHRPLDLIRIKLGKVGLQIINETSVNGFDVESFCAVPEFLILEAKLIPKIKEKTSLLIKACALDAETSFEQIRHLVKTLSRPRRFDEVAVLVDGKDHNFTRAHNNGNLKLLRQNLNHLKKLEYIDTIIDELPSENCSISTINKNWFGKELMTIDAMNGQPVSSILHAFETCLGDYIFHADIDVLIAKNNHEYDFIYESIALFHFEKNAITITPSIYGEHDITYSRSYESGLNYRVEAMIGWINRERLLPLRPLTADEQAGKWHKPWHRILDDCLASKSLGTSLRQHHPDFYFVALDNARKFNILNHHLLINAIENGYCPNIQSKNPLIQGDIRDWIYPKRSEDFIIIMIGRNVSPAKLSRCFASLAMQTDQNWGLIVIDDNSNNASLDWILYLSDKYAHKMTLIKRYIRCGYIQNLFFAVRDIISNKDSVVISLDIDDALAHKNAIALVKDEYKKGADVTIGSMLRTDKHKDYPVSFENVRKTRGIGNIWQHLRSFKKHLFDKITSEDLKHEGQWIELSNDWAYMLPIIELSHHPREIKEKLYLHEPSTSREASVRRMRMISMGKTVSKPSYENKKELDVKVRVLCYHRIIDQNQKTNKEDMYFKRRLAVSTHIFQQQIYQEMQNGTPITADDLILAINNEKSLPENSFLITIDNGYKDYLVNAHQFLQNAGIKPILFMRKTQNDNLPYWAPFDLLYIGRGINGNAEPLPNIEFLEKLLNLHAQEQLQLVCQHLGVNDISDFESERAALYLSDDDIRKLQNITIAGQGIHHHRWNLIESHLLLQEIEEMASWLESVNGSKLVAYPNGEYDEDVIKALMAAKFEAGFTINPVQNIGVKGFNIQRHIMIDNF